MSFLNPLFLIALAGGAVPVLIHLLTRDRIQHVAFSTVRFFAKGAKLVVRRSKFRELLLLLLRVAIAMLLAFIFARPFFKSKNDAGPQTAATARVIVMDVSGSMRRAGLPEALKKEAADAAGTLNDGADAAALITFADAPDVLEPLGKNLAAVKAAAGQVTPGYGGTNISEALRKANELLAGVNAKQKEIVLISDLQRQGWSYFKGDWKLASDVKLTVRAVKPTDAGPGFGIVEATAPDSLVLDRQPSSIAVRIANYSGQALNGLDVTLNLSGTQADAQTVNIRPNGAAAVRFRHVFDTPGDNPGSIVVGKEGAQTFYFNSRILPRIPVLLVNGHPSMDPQQDAAIFIGKALAPTDTSPFAVTTAPADKITPQDVAAATVVVLADVGRAPAPVIDALQALLARGGGVFLLPGDDVNADAFNAQFGPVAPCKLRQILLAHPADGQAAETLTHIDFDHPIFEVFALPHHGDLTLTNFAKYWETTDTQLSRVLARFGDGRPAIMEREIGKGISIAMVSAVNPQWNDLSLQSVFLPLMHQTLRYLAVRAGERTAYVSGDLLPVPEGGTLKDPEGKARPAGDNTAAALSGLAIVMTESIGILTGMLLLDWLYQPRPEVRIGMWGVALAGIVWLVLRHVAAPLSRRIPDEQIAMYIEEHRNDLDGLLITAAEYGGRRDRLAEGHAALIDMVVNEASSRAGRAASQTVDFSRLKKYGVGAAAGIGIYILLSILFPNAVGHHLGRILQPWLATAEDLPKRPPNSVPLEPIRFTLSKGDASLARGESFDFEAMLSRAAEKPVVLNFRPRAEGEKGAWQHLPMTEIEKLNGYQGTLSDVSEDLEFYVSSGADRSDTHRLTVFDPLVVQSMEVTTHYPAYLKLPDKVENPSSGDIEAVIGSTMTVRIDASTPLKEGTIKWDKGQTQPLALDPKSPASGTFSFEVKEDGAYDYALTDANGQKAASEASLSVKAIPDQPPTLSVKAPFSPVLSNPVGEVHFVIEAGDDFGVEGVDLVYSRLDDKQQPQETRIPLTLTPGDTKATPNAVESTYTLMLENATPPLKPDDAITYHLEARDAKGQKAVSDIGFIVIGNYETWGTWDMPHGPEPEHAPHPDLMAILDLVWTLQGEKPTLAPKDFQSQSKDIASKMVDANGDMLSFVDLEEMPQLAKVADKIALHAKKGHDALVVADTATATSELGIATTLLAGYSLKENNSLHTSAGGAATGNFAAPALTMLEQARLNGVSQSAADKAHEDQEKKEAEVTAATGKQIQDLLKQQDDVIAKAQSPSGGGAKEPQPSALADTEKDLAQKTKAAADAAKGGAGNGAAAKLQEAGAKAADAAKAMEEAAKEFAAGRNAEGGQKAAAARKALQEAGDTLQDTSRDKLEAAISDAASHAAALLDKQRSLRADGESMAKELDGGKTPDQRQTRDLQKQAYQETGLHGDADSLTDEIKSLNAWAATVGEPESIRSLGEAQKTVKRAQPESKMAGAIIDLNNGAPASAVDEQKEAEAALEKIVDSLHNGSDALAASREAQLRRAQRNAEEARKGLDELMKQAGQAGQESKQGHAAGAQAQAATKTGAQGKQGEAAGAESKQGQGAGAQAQAGTHAGEEAKPGEAAGAQSKEGQGAGAQAQAGTQAGEQAKAGETAGAQAQQGQGAGAQAQPGTQAGEATQQSGTPGAAAMSGGGRQEMLQKLAYDLQRLATNLDNRDLVPQQDVDLLKGLTTADLEKRLAVDPKLLRDTSDIVGRISDKLEAETEAKTEASKLFSSQREECPPAYRQFVNQYFEALSQMSTPSQETGKP
jgi:hypothetical protein